jgi:hypothetical protein
MVEVDRPRPTVGGWRGLLFAKRAFFLTPLDVISHSPVGKFRAHMERDSPFWVAIFFPPRPRFCNPLKSLRCFFGTKIAFMCRWEGDRLVRFPFFFSSRFALVVVSD